MFAAVPCLSALVVDDDDLDPWALAEELASLNEAVIQSSPVGIAVYGADGRCLLANAALADALASTQAVLHTQNFRQLPAWRESELLADAEATLADGLARRCEVHGINASGGDVWLECGLATIGRPGERRLLLMAHDVTRQRAAQAELAGARDVARAATQAKSAFLANMSHEIRTPMNGIIGLSRLALEDELPPRARSFLEKVHSSALALMGILDDVLDYSKIEAGQMRFESVEFELDTLLERVAVLFAASIEQKGLEFVFDVLPEVPDRLIGDPLRLSQVLGNLVGNAIKFTEQGMIEVRVSLLEPVHGATCHLRFDVQDTGVGIGPDSQPGLFDAFTQADNSIPRRFGGSGLGLMICKRLVEQMDGVIAVDSAPGHGSDFHFTAKLGVASATPPHSRTEFNGLRALVVDDNPVSRRVLASQLESIGIQAAIAPDGAMALSCLVHAYAQRLPVSLVLLDAGMPGMDGAQTLRELRAQALREGHAPVRVVMLASSGQEYQLASTAAAQPDLVLAKPVLRTRLREAVLHVLHGGVVKEQLVGPLSTALLRAQLADLAGTRVLLVEDDAVNQLVALETLRRLGMEAMVASDGVDALDVLGNGDGDRFDVVLMDLHMPRMNGFEATRRIHALPGLAQLPVIAMSAAVLPEDRASSFEAGMVDHLAKPVMAERLVEVLLKWARCFER